MFIVFKKFTTCGTVLQYYMYTDITMECVLNVLLSNGN